MEVQDKPEIGSAKSPVDGTHPLISGEGGRQAGKLLAPKPAEIRQMLKELRKTLGWSQSDAAMVLDVSVSCVAKWETGARLAGGPAAKWIYFLHAQFVDNQGKMTLQDLTFWGQLP